jgi:hypothetical protein
MQFGQGVINVSPCEHLHSRRRDATRGGNIVFQHVPHEGAEVGEASPLCTSSKARKPRRFAYITHLFSSVFGLDPAGEGWRAR